MGAFCRATLRFEVVDECATYLECRIGTITQPESVVSDDKIFAVPKKVENVADCYFYHTMEVPGYGLIEGKDWDLRAGVDWRAERSVNVPPNSFMDETATLEQEIPISGKNRSRSRAALTCS